MNNWISRLRREDGQALVEFALAIPLLLLVLFAIIQFGEAINYYNEETNVSNIAARYAIVGTTPSCSGAASSAISDYVKCTATAESNALSSTTTCVVDLASGYAAGSTPAAGDPIDVIVKVPFNLTANLPIFGSAIPANITITASATMRNETSSWDTTYIPTSSIKASTASC
jgi:Flp pilus assembly protein TadG